MKRLRGIDVSVYQGVITDAIAAALVTEGCAFAYVRAAVGTGTLPDARLKANIAVFKAHGIPCGPYMFPYPLPHLDPVAQADLHARIAEGLGTNIGELAPMIDAEWPPPEEYKVINGVKTLTYPWQTFGCSPAQLRSWLEVYGERLDTLSGCVCPYYTYRYWDTRVEAWLSSDICARPLILADYTYKGIVPTDEQLAKVAVPRGRTKITILQHDGDGGLRLPGSAADVDWNVMPDPADLVKLTGQPGTPVTPDGELADLAAAAHAGGQGLIVEDAIAAYRRDRLDAQEAA